MRLVNVLHTDKKLTLVFEYLDQDLKKLLDTVGPQGFTELEVKVIFGCIICLEIFVPTFSRNCKMPLA